MSVGEAVRLKHLLDKTAALKKRQVLDFFTRADEASGHAELILNCDHASALPAAVKLRDDQARQARGLLKLACLRERVATGRGVDDEE